jgi:hypothetical protein
MSTWYPTYTGLHVRNQDALPRVPTPEAKSRILGSPCAEEGLEETEETADKRRDLPLWWAESKGVAFFSQLLADWGAAQVLDATAGSGAVAAACLHMAIPYAGVAKNSSHQAFLNGAVDRAILPHVVRKGGPLFLQSVASLVATHYQEEIEAADKQADLEKEATAESDGEECGDEEE